jgi:hypothetical protein
MERLSQAVPVRFRPAKVKANPNRATIRKRDLERIGRGLRPPGHVEWHGRSKRVTASEASSSLQTRRTDGVEQNHEGWRIKALVRAAPLA